MRHTLLGGALAAPLALVLACPAFAQISGTFSATLSGFQPTPAYSQLSASNVTSSVALPSGTTVVVYNTGSTAAYVRLGTSNVAATTTAGDVIQPNSWMAFTVGSNTYLAAITSSGATALTISGGTGLAAGTGGGGSGGGGSGGLQYNSSAPTLSSGQTVALQGDSSGNLKVDIASPIPTGSNTIGAVNLGTLNGAATAANQPALNGDGGALAHVTNFPATQTVSAVSLPLPSNAAQESGGNLATVAANTAKTNAGTSATSALPIQGVSGGVPVPVSGAFWQATQPVSLASLPALASGSNTIGAVTQASGPWTVNQTQINGVALGSPSNYGTSPGAVPVQGVNAYVTNTPAVSQSGAWNITNISGTVSLPTGASTSSNQTSGSQKTQIVDGLGNVIGSTSNSLNVQCANCSGSGAGAADGASFTAGSAVFAPNGGVYQSTSTSNPLTSGKQGLAQLTQYRALFTNLRDSSSNELGIASNPLQVSLANTGANGTALAVSNSQEHTDLMTLNATINSPPQLNVNGTSASWTGLTPGTSQTGVIVASNTDLTSVGGKAVATAANGAQMVGIEGHAGAAIDGPTGSAAPANALEAGVVSSGNLVGLIQADNSASINVSTATTTQLVPLSSGKKIYVTSYDVVAGGTGNLTFEYGAGSNCGTGTTALTGAYNLTAQSGIAKGNGLGPVLVVPAGNALCVLTTAAVQMSGSVSYTEF